MRPNMIRSMLAFLACASLLCAADITNGLVAYYPFNGNANDETGNGHNGTVFGAALATDRMGVNSACYLFDGINDYISVPDSSAWAFGTQDFSLSFWFNISSSNSDLKIFLGNDNGPYYQNKWLVELFNYTRLGFNICSPSLGTQVIISTNLSVILTKWYHLAVTRQGSLYKLYLDGRTAAESINTLAIPDASAPLTIGTAEDRWVHGLMDDVRIYNRALSASEVAQLAAVALNTPTGEYCIVDVSGGPTATSYPVTYISGAQPSGDEYKTSKIVLRKIPAGSFVMGSPTNEIGRSSSPGETQHNVTLTKSFYMGVYEITQAQYTNVMGVSNPAGYKDAMRPVEQASWNTVRGGTWPGGTPAGISFMGKLQSKTGFAFDLPTEAQWEYACRATTTKALNNNTDLVSAEQDPNMDILGRYTYNGGSVGQHAIVGSYLVNQWGLYDMHGNVWEWCLDWYGNEDYSGEPVSDPVGQISGLYRAVRGGGWDYSANGCRSAFRNLGYPASAYNTLGFRLCLPAGQNQLPPNPPNNVQASDGTYTNSVRVTWSAASDVTKYKVYRNTINSTNTAADISGDVVATQYYDTAVIPVQTYYYWVKAGNSNGWSDFSTSDSGYAGNSVSTGEYCIVDVSGGPNAANYPVIYQATAPPLNDEYKTSKIVLRKIPAGSFVMGSPTNELGRDSDETQHNVTLTRYFYIGIYEITQAQYSNVMGANPSYFKQGAYAPKRPVEQVSWSTIRGGIWPSGAPESSTFMGKLRSKTGLIFDLPTEAQWEYACRATTTNALNNNTNLQNTGQDPNMDILGRYWYNGGVNFSSDPVNGAHTTVGSYLVNQWGLYDMHGNVWEWCLDWYETYFSGPVSDPVGPASGSGHVICGGSWPDIADGCRSAIRFLPGGAGYTLGFRLCLPAGQNELPPNPPANVQASDGTFTNSVRVVWSAVSEATKYKVYRNTINSTNTAADISGDVDSTQYFDSTVIPVQTYYYWVRAGNSNGWSNFSASDSGYAGQSVAIPTVAPTALNFTSNVTVRFINMGNGGTAPYTFNANVTTGGSWLSVNPASASVSNLTIALAATVSRSGLANGIYNGTIAITTSAGTSVVVTAQMIVAGNAVIAEANGPYFVNQGSPAVLTAAGSQGQNLRYRWEVGLDYISSYSSGNFNLAYTNTLMPQVLDVVLTVRDTNSPPNTGSDSTTLTIQNVPPTLDLGGPYMGSTTNPIAFTTTLSDPGLLDTHLYRWDFNGDGTWDTGWLGSNAIAHLYVAGGSYIVQCEVKDNYGGVGSDMAAVLVEMPNVPPVAAAVINGTALIETNLPGLGCVVTLNGLGSYDPDSKPLTNLYFDWREDVNNPQKPVIPEASLHNQIVTTVPLNEMGQYKFHLVVCDGEYNSQPATVTVHVPGWRGEVISEGYMAKIPLWGVQAVVTNTYNHQLKTGRSDAAGNFLADSGAGYQMALLTRRSMAQTLPISIGVDGSFMENIYFTPNFYIYAGQIVTGAPGSFVGLYQANVQILIGNGLSSRTDAMGAYGFGTVPESWPADGAAYKVRIQKTGFRSELQDLLLTMNRNSETLVMTPAPANIAVGGAIRSEKSGGAVAGVVLDFGNGWAATSGVAGVFGPVTVPPGDYAVKLSKQGFSDTFQYLTGLAADTLNLDFVIQGGEVSMYGEILDGNGFVVTNAFVNLAGVAGRKRQEAEHASVAGYYDLTVAKGTRQYIVSAPGFEPQEITVSNVNEHTKLNVILVPEPTLFAMLVVGGLWRARMRKQHFQGA